MQRLDPITGRETMEYIADANRLYRHWVDLTHGLTWQTPDSFRDRTPLWDLMPADVRQTADAVREIDIRLISELRALPHNASPFIVNMFRELDRILCEFIRKWELL